jgi:hypothetical protein
LLGRPVDVPGAADMDAAAQALGIALPPSYATFARKYGNGLTCNLFMIYVPMSKAGYSWSSGLPERSADLRDDIARALGRGRLQLQPGQTVALVERLVPFADSENGDDILAWDPEDRAGDDGELAIYAVDDTSSLRKVAPDLGDLLRRVARPSTGGVLAGATFTLPLTFEPRPGRGND